MSASAVRVVASVIALAVGLSGCSGQRPQLVTTPPVEDPVVETAPLSDDDFEEEVIVEDIVYDSIEECLEGSWAIDNVAFGQFFAQSDDRIVAIDVEGVATMAIEGDTFRMFFEEWDIRYDTGDPTFLISRNGNETIQFVVTPDNVFEVVERDDQILLELFSIVGAGDGEGIAIATNDPGPLPLEGATLQCTSAALEVFVEQDSFLFVRL